MVDPLLEAAYRNTCYIVDHPDGVFGIRIGLACVRLDALLTKAGVATWAYVSACNPRSQPVAATDNAARHARLLTRVRALGLTACSGRGRADDGDWVEESLLILGLDEPAAVALGAAFGQNAVVVGRLGESARLVWCAPSTA